ncbi:hypothetical protein A2U01_0014559, partial [Trifolium medium]|nr:hypothetical protein [Trifolium medium]
KKPESSENQHQGKRKSSPFDLNSNDNPGNLITQVQLRGENNYDEWTRAMKTSLRARRKWGFIEGTVKKPDEGTVEIEDWWTVQSMLVSWILNTVEPNLRSTMTYMENARDLWEDIKERFSVANGPKIHQLKADLVACKQAGMTIAAYYGKLKLLWDELANYEQVPVCSCEGCSCGITTKLEKRREEERVHQFLMGLDDVVYGTARSNLLASDPLPNLNRIYSVMIQEERVRTIARNKEERGEVMGLAVQIGGKNRGRDEFKDKCTNCNIDGHDAANCFQLIGYPDWWGDRPRGQGKSGTRGRSQNRGAGRGKGAAIVRANAAQAGGNSSAREAESHGFPGITSDQWQKLMEILNIQPDTTERMTGKSQSNEWILDSGASNHMTGTLEIMRELHDIQTCPIGLPDGKNASATKEGVVLL